MSPCAETTTITTEGGQEAEMACEQDGKHKVHRVVIKVDAGVGFEITWPDQKVRDKVPLGWAADGRKQ